MGADNEMGRNEDIVVKRWGIGRYRLGRAAGHIIMPRIDSSGDVGELPIDIDGSDLGGLAETPVDRSTQPGQPTNRPRGIGGFRLAGL